MASKDKNKVDNAAKIQTLIADLQKDIKEWNIIQHVRLLQQLLCIASVSLGLGSIFASSVQTAGMLSSMSSFMLAGVSFIPGILDAKYRYKRSVPIVIKGVMDDENEVKKQESINAVKAENERLLSLQQQQQQQESLTELTVS